jgi:hypothetical protein
LSRKIDALFKQKSQELDQLVDEKITKGKERIDRIRLEALEVIKKKEATQQDIVSLMSTIRQLEKTIDNIEQTCFTLSIRPLVIDDTTVVLKKTSELDLSTLPVYKTISCSTKDSYVLASNDRFLLIHQEPNLCFVDRQMNIVKHAVWSRDLIYDICWSSTLDRFIVIGGRRIFLVNKNSVACENAETIEKREWLSCTCSETSLFLSTNTYSSCIMEFRLSPAIELVKTWKSPQTCARVEAILNIRYNNEKLALMVKNKSEKSLRIELRCAETLDHVWSLRLDTVFNQNKVFPCCSLTCDEWLVTDYENKCLLQITADGKMKQTIPYDAVPHYVNLFANMLVVRNTGGLNCHKL